jgi:hypothetical protein
MKIGIECEGRLRGIKTLFMNADEDLLKAADILVERGIGHVSNFFQNAHVTLDVTEVKDYCPRDNISIMFRIDKCPQDKIFDSIKNLRSDLDQIKIERDRQVVILPISCALTTEPHEFEGDIEL